MPAPEASAGPALKAPPGTIDTHIHIYGTPDRYPVAPTNLLPVPDAPLDAYKRNASAVG